MQAFRAIVFGGRCLTQPRINNQLRTRCVFYSQTFSNSQLNPPVEGPPVSEEEEEVSTNVRFDEENVVDQPPNPKLLRVSIVGLPNAGKSTLVNTLIESEVCPVSKRVHTTRRNQRGIYLEENTQLIFVDTPGLTDKRDLKRFDFGGEFVQGPDISARYSDVIAVIHDVSNKYNRWKLDSRIIKLLEKFHEKEAILLLNKVDIIKKKRRLLDTINHLTCGIVGGEPISTLVRERPGKNQRMNMDKLLDQARFRIKKDGGGPSIVPKEPEEVEEAPNYDSIDSQVRGWPQFQSVFMLSALTGEGMEDLRKFFIERARPNPWRFSKETLTDAPAEDLAVRIVKSKLLEVLQDEIPYNLNPRLELWKEQATGVVRVVVGIRTSNERYHKNLIGLGGVNIQKITKDAEDSLSRIINKPIDLFIHTEFIDKSRKPK